MVKKSRKAFELRMNCDFVFIILRRDFSLDI